MAQRAVVKLHWRCNFHPATTHTNIAEISLRCCHDIFQRVGRILAEKREFLCKWMIVIERARKLARAKLDWFLPRVPSSFRSLRFITHIFIPRGFSTSTLSSGRSLLFSCYSMLRLRVPFLLLLLFSYHYFFPQCFAFRDEFQNEVLHVMRISSRIILSRWRSLKHFANKGKTWRWNIC